MSQAVNLQFKLSIQQQGSKTQTKYAQKSKNDLESGNQDEEGEGEEKFPSKKYTKNELARINYYRRSLIEPEFDQEQAPNMSIQLMDEKEFNMGDYVIVLKNPDHKDFKFKNHTITLEDIIFDFNKCFQVETLYDSVGSQMELLFIAFQQAFLKLQDAKNVKEEIEIDRVQKEIKEKKLKQRRKTFLLTSDGSYKIQSLSIKKCYGRGEFNKLEGDIWQRTGKPVLDYQTLLRHLLILKLSILGGFYIRQFMTSNGTQIFLVLFQETFNLQTEACRLGMNKQVEFQSTDLLSLEPVNSKLRPLRLSRVLQPDSRIYNRNVKKLKQEILDLLKQIDFKKVCKEINLEPYENHQVVRDDVEESLETWYQILYSQNQVSLQILFIKIKISDRRSQIKIQSLILFKYLKILTSKANINNEEIHHMVRQWLKKPSFKVLFGLQFKTKSKKQYVLDQERKMQEYTFINSQDIKAVNIRKKAEEYDKAFRDALIFTQKKYGNTLKTLWDHCNIQPMSAFIGYFSPQQNQSHKNILKQEQIWQRYTINQKGKQEVFMKVDRNKLCVSILAQMIDLNQCSKICGQLKNIDYLRYIDSHFIPNDQYDLKGEKYKNAFKPIKLAAKIDKLLVFSYHSKDTVKNSHKKKIQNQTDYKEKKKIQQRIRSQNLNGGLDGSNLKSQWEWSIIKIPTPIICLYYGERIALYFKFLGFFTKQLFIIGLISVPIFLAQCIIQNDMIDTLIKIGFLLIIIFWSSLFVSNWVREEQKFRVITGQDEQISERNQLVSFKGPAKRSFLNDNLNDPECKMESVYQRFFITLLFIFGILSVEVGIMVGLLYLMLDLETMEALADAQILGIITLQVFIPVLIWMFITLIFDEAFKIMAYKLSKWENHKYLTTFENSYIIKILIFCTLNRMGLPFFISFINSTSIGCLDGECFQQLDIYMRSSFAIQLCKNLFIRFIIPSMRFTMKRTEISVKQKLIKSKKYTDSPFYELNYYLESENSKDKFGNHFQIDGTIDIYLEIIVQFALLTNYGLPFPPVYIIAFAGLLIEIQIVKISLMEFTQKPPPMSSSNLGVFNFYLQLMTYIAIFINSGIITVTNRGLFPEEPILGIFLGFVTLFYIFKFFIDQILSGKDDNFNQIRIRHKSIQNRVRSGMGKQPKDSQPTFPILKPFGTRLVPRKQPSGNKIDMENIDEESPLNQPPQKNGTLMQVAIGIGLFNKNSQNISPENSQNISPEKSQNISPEKSQNAQPELQQNIQPKNKQNGQPVKSQNLQPVKSQTLQPVKSQNLQPVKSKNL